MEQFGWKRSGKIAAAIVSVALAASAFAYAPRADASAFPGANGNIVYSTDVAAGTIFQIDQAGLNIPQQLTANAIFTNPAFNASASQIIAETAGGFVTFAPTPGAAQTVVPGTLGADNFPSWNPAGTGFAFDNGGDIFTQDLTGANRNNLTGASGTVDANPEYSADGSFIAYESGLNIRRVAPAGGNILQVNAAGSCGGGCNSATVSPDNNFVGFIEAGNVVKALSNGSSAANFTVADQAGALFRPTFSPDNTKVAFLNAAAALQSASSAGTNVVTTIFGGPAQRPNWGTGGAVTPPPGSGSAISISDASAEDVKKGPDTECVFTLTTAPAGEATATATVSGVLNKKGVIKGLDDVGTKTATVDADGTSTITFNAKHGKNPRSFTVTLTNPSTGDTLGDAQGTCAVSKRRKG